MKLFPLVCCFAIVLSLVSRAEARPGSGHPGLERTLDAVMLHRANQSRSVHALAVQPKVNLDQGNISVLQDDGTLIIPRNFFDLANRSLSFTPQQDGYVVEAGTAVFDGGQGSAVTQSLGDDDSVEVSLPAPFPFYGRTFNSVFVNTDGNLTFGAPDTASSDRNLLRVVQGVPRIAPLFDDFLPSSTGFVTTEKLSDRLIVYWHSISEFDTTSNRSTFQVILRSSGTITFNYSSVSISGAVVAISPGNGASFNIADLSLQNKSVNYAGTVAENFATFEQLDLAAISQTFYRTHDDGFHTLMIFTDFSISLQDAFAYELPVRNSIQGIMPGVPDFDYGPDFGSASQLTSVVNGGAVSQYPSDPQQIFLGTNNTLEVLGQEFGHRWMAYVDTNPSSMLGRDLAHWSFFMNTFGSVMEGNEISDLGNGMFRTVTATYQYSPLDQYLMGLRSASEVPPWFVVANPRLISAPSGYSCMPFNAACPPAVGVTMQGTRRNMTIDDVLSIAGPRIPASDVELKDLTVAFILVTKQSAANTTNLSHLDRIRQQWEPFFEQAVAGRATMSTTLQSSRPSISAVQPAAGLTIGGAAVTIHGSNFQPDSQVTIGSRGAAITAIAADSLQVVVPRGDLAGPVPVTVTSPSSGQSVTLANGFTYLATITSQLSLAVSTNGSADVETLEPSSPLQVGFAVVQAPLAAAVLRSFSGSRLVSEASVPATEAATHWMMYAEKATGVSTGVAIANPNALPANIVLTLNNGARTTLTIPVNGQRAAFVDELFNSVQPFLGTLTLDSDVPVAVFALRGSQNVAREFVMATVALSSATPQLGGSRGFPIVADGGGYNSELILVNSGVINSTGNIQFSFAATTDSGTGFTFPFNIPPGVVWRLRTPGTAASLISGSAVLSADSGSPLPEATAMIRFSSSAGLISETAIPARREQTQGVMFGSFDANRRTGIAILNPNPQPVQVTISARDGTGNLVGSGPAVVSLAPFGRSSQFLDELVSKLPAGFEGTVSMEASAAVQAISLRGTTLSDGRFLMAAMPLADPSAANVQPLYFPQVVSGGGFSTEFLVGGSLPATAVLGFFDGNGKPLAFSLH